MDKSSTVDHGRIPVVRLGAFPSPAGFVFFLIAILVLIRNWSIGPAAIYGTLAIGLFALHPLVTAPERLIRRYRMEPWSPIPPELDQDLNFALAASGQRLSPIILKSLHPLIREPFVISSLTRRYMVVPMRVYERFSGHRDELRALFIHELTHFRTGDATTYRLTIGLCVYLAISLVSQLWSLIPRLLIGVGTPETLSSISNYNETFFSSLRFLYTNQPPIQLGPAEQFASQFANAFPNIALLALSVPICFMAISVLLQSREYYADATAAEHGRAQSLALALILIGLSGGEHTSSQTASGWRSALNSLVARGRLLLRVFFRMHPRSSDRLASLENPAHALELFIVVALLGGVITAAMVFSLGVWYGLDANNVINGFVLTWICGFTVLSLMNDADVVANYANPRQISLNIIKRTMAYISGLLIAILLFGLAQYFDAQLLLQLVPQLATFYNIHSALPFIYFEVLIPFLFVVVVLPAMLLSGLFLDAATKRAAIIDSSKRLYIGVSATTFLFVLVAQWLLVGRLAVVALIPRVFAPNTLINLVATWPTVIGIVCLVLVIINLYSAGSGKHICARCGTVFQPGFEGRFDCPSCGRTVFEWGLADYG